MYRRISAIMGVRFDACEIFRMTVVVWRFLISVAQLQSGDDAKLTFCQQKRIPAAGLERGKSLASMRFEPLATMGRKLCCAQDDTRNAQAPIPPPIVLATTAVFVCPSLRPCRWCVLDKLEERWGSKKTHSKSKELFSSCVTVLLFYPA